MNIYLGEKAQSILDDENALKQNLAEFLRTDQNSNLVLNLIMRLKISRISPELLALPFMSLKFYFWAGLITTYVFIYRRLYLGFIIAFLTSMAFSYFLGSFSIITFIISIFVFGKLYEYFLIKKFIENINNDMPITNKCAPSILGLILYIIIGPIISIAMFFFNTASSAMSFMSLF